MIAVPQSGPIISSDRSAAYRFRSTSVSTGTLSLNSITCSPARNAFHASAPAYIPGTEMSATFAPGSIATAETSVRGRRKSAAAVGTRGAASAVSAASWAAVAARALAARIAMTRSAGAADSPSAASSPACRINARFCGVPIIAAAIVTPSTASMSRESRMRVTES